MSEETSVFNCSIRCYKKHARQNFCVFTNRVNRNTVKFNWLCSSGLIRTNAGRIPIYKTTYFKNVKVLFDGVREVNCNGSRKYYVDVQVCEGKMLLPEHY